MWDGTQVLLPPSFAWGNRVAAPRRTTRRRTSASRARTSPRAWTSPISLTKVWGRHTIKTGFFNQYSNKQQVQGGAAGGPSLNFQQDTVGTNPFDTSFGFANAAIGCFSSYTQASKGVEGNYIYYNTEAYVQDNWQVNSKLTLDYGVRFVHQPPQYDARGQASNFFLDQWSAVGGAGAVRRRLRQRRLSLHRHQPPGAEPADRPVPGAEHHAGDRHASCRTPATSTNGLVQAGQGIPLTTYLQPALGVAPRFGMAYDLTGKQKIVLRGGGGLFFDRPSGNAVFGQVLNPPTRKNVTLRYGQLQTLGAGGLATEAPPSLSVYEYDSPLPSSRQWNVGVQMALPWGTVVDVSYVGQHGYNIVEGININAVDFGSAFLARTRIRRLAPTTPGATSRSTDLMRAFRGYSSITQNVSRGWLTHHSLQLSLNRRFRNGLSFGFNDTIGLSTRGSVGARLQHNADGTFSYRADQAEADDLLQTPPTRHTMKGNFVWDLPDLHAGSRRSDGARAGRQRLAAGPGSGPRRPRNPYTVGYNYQSGGGIGEPHRLAGLRRAHPHPRRPRPGLQQRPLPPVQRRGVRRAAGRQRRPRVRQRLSARLLLAGLRPGDRQEHPAARRPDHPAARRPVQCLQPRRHHRPEHDACSSIRRPTRSPTCSRRSIPVTGLLNNGVNLTSTGAREREPVAAEERRVRRRQRLPGAAQHPAADPVRVLTSGPPQGRGRSPRPCFLSGVTHRCEVTG